ncbi:FtsX-like permease family protein [Kitasatospora sp. NBC_01287]|uniref:ABC transporter permease n=1 Tax=Kitasatospora sp. NBC_01287 TaxID=2903573 RepID=UPI00224D72D0|nr:FtsX-like permease family protein [Kitasatospora sp. NBC_01287]MCX4745791.1 FtsX-like permease family protein [Kitasatospora sp. NBC_01287]
MSALSKVIRAGVGRRRIQSLVITLTTLAAVTASVLALGLLQASQTPFDHAFAQQHGAHLTAQFDPSKVTAAQLATTARMSGVTAATGPSAELQLTPHAGRNDDGLPVGSSLPSMLTAGRADAGGPIDDLALIHGHWLTGPGQIVLSDDPQPVGVGDQLVFPQLPGSPALTIVGIARSMSRSADAWVSPDQLAALTPPGAVPDYQMSYRFAQAGTDAQLDADRAALAAAVPAGAMTGVQSYLSSKLQAQRNTATFVPFIVVFGLIALFMSVLIISIVVSGAVSASTRRIGILKSLGFTPSHVARAYVGQALIPSAVGTVLGVLLGNLMATAVLTLQQHALSGGTVTIAPWIDLVVPLGALAAVTAAALVPALRAGRLRTVEALAVGRTPSAGRGRVVQHFLGRLRLPRAMSLGLGLPFAKPGRSGVMIAAVVLGTVGVTFGTGLTLSLNAVEAGLSRDLPGSVVAPVAPLPDAPAATRQPDAADLTAIAAKIAALPGTRRSFATGTTKLSVAGLAGPTDVTTYRGDSSWGAYQLVHGSWFHGPGEVVVPTSFLRNTGTHVGETITLTGNGRAAPARIVGEAMAVRDSGMLMLTDDATLSALGIAVDPESVTFAIDLVPGTSTPAYLDSLNTALRPYGITALPGAPRVSPTVLAMDGLAVLLTALLVTVAGLGVLNTVVLDTRERVHDLGVYKALGMSPKQTVAMVLTSVTGIGLVASAIGVPIGIVLHHYVLPAMGTAAGTGIPTADLAVFHLPVLVPLLLGGLVIATAGALLPAGWAARTRTATALRTE